MRRWLLILIPALLLLLLWGALRVFGARPVIVSGPPGALLYAAAFDGFPDEWDAYDDGQLAAGITDAAYVVRVGEGGGAAFGAAQPVFADFDLRVTAEAVAGPVDNGFGVLFRLQDNGNLLPSDDQYYAFLISSDGYYSVRRRTSAGEQEISTWIPSDLIRQGLGARNDIRVVGQGADFQFFINDQPVQLCIPSSPTGRSTFAGGTCRDGEMRTVLTDAAIPAGQIGLLAIATPSGGGGVEAAFDNVLVFSPAEPAE